MHEQGCTKLWWGNTSLELLHISLPHFCHTLTQLWAKPCVANFMVVSYTILETWFDLSHFCFMPQQGRTNLWWEDSSLEQLDMSLKHFCQTLTGLWGTMWWQLSHNILEPWFNLPHFCFMPQQVRTNLWWVDKSLEQLDMSLPHFCVTLSQNCGQLCGGIAQHSRTLIWPPTFLFHALTSLHKLVVGRFKLGTIWY